MPIQAARSSLGSSRTVVRRGCRDAGALAPDEPEDRAKGERGRYPLALGAASLLYLYVPLVIFAWGWLKPGLAAALTALLVGTAWRLCREVGARDEVSRRVVIWSLVLAIGWTLCAGVGGIGHQSSDWTKHEAVLKALVANEWPVMIDGEVEGVSGRRHALVLYLGYYLPAATVGKALGWQAANFALFGWTAGGVLLVLLWVERLIAAGPWAAVVFIFAGGLDVVACLLLHGNLFELPEHVEWWSGIWLYPSNSNLLFWVPHQALGAWLATAMLLDGYLSSRSSQTAFLEFTGAAFHSPFAVVGMVPLLALRLARQPRDWLTAWPTWTTVPTAGAILAAFYHSLRTPIPWAVPGVGISGRVVVLYLLFVGIEFGAFLLMCRPAANGEWKAVWLVVGATLAVIPFVRAGLFNDFVMRASIPALFTLWILVARSLLRPGLTLARRRALACLVTLAALGPGNEIVRSIADWQGCVPELNGVAAVVACHPNRHVVAQYLGDPDAFFFKVLARRAPGGEHVPVAGP